MATLFQQMAQFAPPQTRVIREVTWQNKTDHICVDLVTEIGEESQKTIGFFIKHDDFRTWLEDGGRLEDVHDTSNIVSGEHEQTVYETGYVDFIENDLKGEHLVEYLTEMDCIDMEMDLV